MERWKEKARRLREELSALLLAMKHPQTPWYAKAVAALAVGYALSPIDLIPDFIPVLGAADDLLILPLLILLARRLIPEAVFADCMNRSAELRRDADPKKRWLCAIPVVLLWALIAYLILRTIL